MGLDNPLHIALLLVIVLLVFGAKRLPEMGRSLGSGLRGFKESINGEHHTEQLESADAPTPVAAVVPMPVADHEHAPVTAVADREHAPVA